MVGVTLFCTRFDHPEPAMAIAMRKLTALETSFVFSTYLFARSVVFNVGEMRLCNRALVNISHCIQVAKLVDGKRRFKKASHQPFSWGYNILEPT